jgi:hypothetical protein
MLRLRVRLREGRLHVLRLLQRHALLLWMLLLDDVTARQHSGPQWLFKRHFSVQPDGGVPFFFFAGIIIPA